MQAHAIFGPPGTGKTERLRQIAEMEVKDGNHVVMLSFTRAAAQETASRISGDKITTSTIHALAFKALGVNRQSMVDSKRLEQFSNATGILFRASTDNEPEEGDDYISVHAYAGNRCIPLNEAYDHFGRPGTLDRWKMFTKAYASWKGAYGLADFNDLLDRFVHSEQSKIPQYPVIVLDEAQDCSPLQWHAFDILCRSARRVYIAGDDDQAVYEWNGADPHGMVNFIDRHGGTMEILIRSYRVPKSCHILSHMHALEHISQRVSKPFAPADRAGYIERFGQVHDFNFQSIADTGAMVLVRDRYRMVEIQRILNQEQIPYRCDGAPSPFDNRWARSIRAIERLNQTGEQPSADDRAVLLRCTEGYIKEAIELRNYNEIEGKGWKRILSGMPMRLMELYEGMDLHRPININLSTIHQAKGKEAEHVIIDLELSPRTLNGMMLDHDAEARVMYVALTRTSDKLTLLGENPLI